MAIPLAVDDVVELRVFCTQGVQTAINVIHYVVSALGDGSGTLEDFVAVQSGKAGPVYKPALTDEAIYKGCGAKVIFPVLSASAEVYSIAAAGVGTGGAAALPKQICGVISKRTPFPGPGGTGRMYIPFPDEAFNETTTQPSAAYIALLDDIGDAMLTPEQLGATGQTLSPILYARIGDGVSAVTSHINRPKWGTQRRRGDFGQANSSPI